MIKKLISRLIPTKVITRHDPRTIPQSLAHTLSADDIHDIFRQAEGGHTTKLFALYRDILLAHSHLQGRFADRKRAVLGDTLNIQPFDKQAAADKAAADACWHIALHPQWMAALNHLLDASLWPVAVVEKVYRPSRQPGLRYELDSLVPVPHDLLNFHEGRLTITDTDEAGRPLATWHEPNPSHYIIHRGHLLTTPDHWGGPMRSLVWWWLLGTMDRTWWSRFLERYGSPFMVGKYDAADDDSRGILERAFSLATRLGGLVVTNDTSVELKQAAASDSGDAFEKFHDICSREISKLILGQTLSSDAQATGLGSGVASAQSEVREDIRQFDALLLGTTITNQLAEQFLQINGYRGHPPIFVWGSVSAAEIKSISDFLGSLGSAGLRVADAGIETLSERAGIPLERTQSAPGQSWPFSVHTHSADALPGSDDAIARRASADLSRALGEHLAPVRAIILRSASPQEALQEIEQYVTTLDTSAAARVLEEAMTAYLANGAAVHATNS